MLTFWVNISFSVFFSAKNAGKMANSVFFSVGIFAFIHFFI